MTWEQCCFVEWILPAALVKCVIYFIIVCVGSVCEQGDGRILDVGEGGEIKIEK